MFTGRLNLVFYFILYLPLCSLSQDQAVIKGTVVAASSLEPIAFANVQLNQDGQLLQGTTTNSEGKFYFNQISPGTYSILISYVGFSVYKNF